MENPPLCISDGLEAILEVARKTENLIRLVAVTSSSNGYREELRGNDSVRTKYEVLVMTAEEISYPKKYMALGEDTLLYYTPPSWTSHKLDCHRAEKSPQIIDKENIYLIIDDSFDLGHTSFCATMGLMGQGVALDNIWLDMTIISHKRPAYRLGEWTSLDRAIRFFEYIRYENAAWLTQHARKQ